MTVRFTKKTFVKKGPNYVSIKMVKHFLSREKSIKRRRNKVNKEISRSKSRYNFYEPEGYRIRKKQKQRNRGNRLATYCKGEFIEHSVKERLT